MNSVTRCSRDASLPRTFPVCPCPDRNRIRAVCLKGLWISFRHWYCGLDGRGLPSAVFCIQSGTVVCRTGGLR